MMVMYNGNGNDDNKNISFINGVLYNKVVIMDNDLIYNKVVVMDNDNGKGGSCLMWISRRNKWDK
jgi:hypothetical protein